MLEGLRAKGHNISEDYFTFISVIQAITSSCDRDQKPGCIEAVCDWRKHGAPDGILTTDYLVDDNNHDDDNDADDADDAIQTSDMSADNSSAVVMTYNHAEL